MLAKPALKILLELCKENDNASVFIIALPYLFSTADKDVEIAMEVLHSNFAKNNIYMQHVTENIRKFNMLNAETVSSVAFRNILNRELLPSTESILNAIQQQNSHVDAMSLFLNMVLLGSNCMVPVDSISVKTSQDVIEIVTKMIKTYSRSELLCYYDDITKLNIQIPLKYTSAGILPLKWVLTSLK